MKTNFIVSLFVAFCLLVATPAPVRADSWLDFFFPSLKKKEPDPADTLQAPFADPDAVVLDPDQAGSEGLPDNNTPLQMRHRPSADIAKWLETQIPDLFSYDSKNYKEQYKEKIKNLDTAGKAEYLKFLQDNNFLKTLDTGRYDVKTFIEDVPIVVNEGPVEGSYRWLFQLDVMVTYVQSGADYTKGLKDDQIINQKMNIFVQVGRVKGAKNEHGVLIETISGKLVKNKDKT